MWRQYLDGLFPANINRQSDALVIEDRRQSDEMLVAVIFLAGAILLSAMVFQPLIEGQLSWPGAICLILILVLGVRVLLLPVRTVYVFDKEQGTYFIRRRSLLRSRTTEGSLSQIRAVQIERRVVTDTGGEYPMNRSEIFRIALLLRQGLLLGASDTLLLREERPINSRYESEARIACSIADFLNLPVPDTVDV